MAREARPRRMSARAVGIERQRHRDADRRCRRERATFRRGAVDVLGRLRVRDSRVREVVLAKEASAAAACRRDPGAARSPDQVQRSMSRLRESRGPARGSRARADFDVLNALRCCMFTAVMTEDPRRAGLFHVLPPLLVFDPACCGSSSTTATSGRATASRSISQVALCTDVPGRNHRCRRSALVSARPCVSGPTASTPGRGERARRRASCTSCRRPPPGHVDLQSAALRVARQGGGRLRSGRWNSPDSPLRHRKIICPAEDVEIQEEDDAPLAKETEKAARPRGDHREVL
jgi:hypothetical protein